MIITGTIDGLDYTLRTGDTSAQVRLRSTSPDVTAYETPGGLEVVIAGRRARPMLARTDAALGTGVGQWRLFLTTAERGAALIATRSYKHGERTTADVAAALGLAVKPDANQA